MSHGQSPHDWGTLTAISLGGALGSLARWGLAEALPHSIGGFAWSTLITNLAGSFALGLLVAVAAQRWIGRLTYPFLGVGILGGFTTFSTWMLDTRESWAANPGTAMAYVVATMVGGVACAALGHTVGHRWGATRDHTALSTGHRGPVDRVSSDREPTPSDRTDP